MQRRSIYRLGAVLLSAVPVFMLGCHAGGNGPQYALKGVVLGKSAVTHEITVHQDVIRNFAPAMNAVYKIPDQAMFEQLKAGDEITGNIILAPNSVDNRLEHVAITSRPRGAMPMDALPAHELLIGETVPAIPMVDQDGRKVDFGKYRGKAVLITFVDSKCKEDCPKITRRFAAVNELLKKNAKAYAASHLMTISIDPANDTPPVLRKYGLEYLDGKAEGFSHWEFVDLTPANLKRLATAFGVEYYATKDDISHTMQTALIGADGKLLKMWGGDNWNPAVLAKAVEAAAVQEQKS